MPIILVISHGFLTVPAPSSAEEHRPAQCTISRSSESHFQREIVSINLTLRVSL